MKRTVRQMNTSIPAVQLVMASFMTDSTNDPMIGAIVQFIIRDEEHAKEMGTLACECTYEVIGTQRMWGYDAQGKYTMIDGYRVMNLDYEDGFGRPAAPYAIRVLSTKN